MRNLAGFLLAALVAVPLCGQGVRAGTTGEDAIRQRYARYDATWGSGSAAAMAGFWAKDAVHVEPDGSVVKGRAAIEAGFARRFAAELKGTISRQTVDGVQFLEPDVAVVDATYEVTGARDPEGRPRPALHGRYVDIWVKKGGQWHIAADRPVSAFRPAP